MPFGIGPTELIIILVIVMIIFGVGRLPQVGGALGKAIRDFRKSQEDVAEIVESAGNTAESGNRIEGDGMRDV